MVAAVLLIVTSSVLSPTQSRPPSSCRPCLHQLVPRDPATRMHDCLTGLSCLHSHGCLISFLVLFPQVDYVEPWLAGNARGPSTAFCLLYRLFELKPTEEEVQQTINHEDSAYIRAVRHVTSLLWLFPTMCTPVNLACWRRAVFLRVSWLQLNVGWSHPAYNALGSVLSGPCPVLTLPPICRLASCTCAMSQTPVSCGPGWAPTVTTGR
jgi:hypothetical protein